MATLKEIFDDTIGNIIKLKLGLDVYEYLINDKLVNYRNFEYELDASYPIKGTEVVFSADIFRNWRNAYDNGHIVNEEKDMGSSDVSEELASEPFRYKEMTFVYLFTILEDFGNSIIEIVNYQYYVDFIQEGKSWHSKVNKYAKAKGQDLVSGFAIPFNLQRSEVDEKFVDLFYELKQARNSIAHTLVYPDIRNFKRDVQSLIIMICYIFHINDPTKSNVKFYPWHDYDEDI